MVTRAILRDATANDKNLTMVMQDLERGECRKAITRYEQVLAELCMVDCMLLRGEQLVGPEELQPIVVNLAHEGQLGYEKTMNILRQANWFPGMGPMVRK